MIARLAVVAALLLSVPTTAAAEDAPARRILVFPVTGGDPATAERITAVLARTAGVTGGEVTVGGASFDDAAALAGCAGTGADCLGPVAASLGVDELAIGTLTSAEDGTLIVSLELFRDGAVASHSFTLRGELDAMVTQLAREAAPVFLGQDPDAKPPEDKEPDPPPVVAPPLVAPPAPDRDPASFGRVSTIWWISAAAGVVLAGAGTYFLLEASRLQDEVNTSPVDTAAQLDRLAALEDEGERDQAIGTYLLIGGGVVVAVSGAMILWQGLRPGERRDVTVGAAPIRGGAAVMIEVTLP